jgi:hypothetical protein
MSSSPQKSRAVGEKASLKKKCYFIKTKRYKYWHFPVVFDVYGFSKTSWSLYSSAEGEQCELWCLYAGLKQARYLWFLLELTVVENKYLILEQNYGGILVL